MGNRYYPIGDKELASVTTITGLADKSDALIPWAVNCAVDWIKAHIMWFVIWYADPREGDNGREIDPAVWEKARTEWRTVRDEAGDIGTQVHDALEAYLNKKRAGLICDLRGLAPDDPQATVLFYAAVSKLQELGEYTVLATEQKVVNEDEWYAGRFDALLEVGWETWLIDFKTGASFYPEWGMQLAAYAEAWDLDRDRACESCWGAPCEDDLCSSLKPRIDRIKVLRLDKKTLKAHWKEYGDEKDVLTRAWYYRAFLGLRDAFYVLKAKKAAKLAFMEGHHGGYSSLQNMW